MHQHIDFLLASHENVIVSYYSVHIFASHHMSSGEQKPGSSSQLDSFRPEQLSTIFVPLIFPEGFAFLKLGMLQIWPVLIQISFLGIQCVIIHCRYTSSPSTIFHSPAATNHVM